MPTIIFVFQGLVKWLVQSNHSFSLTNYNGHVIILLESEWVLISPPVKWEFLSCKQRQFPFFDARKHSRFHEPIHVCNWQGTSWENATLLFQGTIEKGPKKNSFCPNMIQLQETSCHYTSEKLLPLDSKLTNWPEGTGHSLCCVLL